MLRLFYACLLRLHPRQFRQRFAEEMLWIFDQETANGRAAPLLADALLSLARQWIFHPGLSEPPALPTLPQGNAGVPVFYTCESSIPRPGALLNGALLSLVVFGSVSLAITHGGSHWKSPAVAAWSQYVDYSSLFGWHTEPRTTAATANASAQRPVPAPATVRRPRLFRALDSDHDLGISPAEIANAPAALRTLDRGRDGTLTLEELGYGCDSVLAALDADHDGTISASEIQNAPAALGSLNRNRDGMLTPEELLCR